MYLQIEKVCERHNLQMCSGYGTVLGALRHQGFIPWDDDMDLLMPREDYDKLIHDFAHELPSNYVIYAPNSKNKPITRFAKVVDTNTRFLEPGASDEKSHGIFIDIFPIENSISNITLIKIKRLFAMFLMVVASSVGQYNSKNEVYKQLMYTSKSGKRTYNIRNFLGRIFSFMSETTWLNILDKFYKHKKYTDVCCVPSGDSAKWKYYYPYPKSLYFPAKKMKFDDMEIYVPAQAERHCEIEYGDWHWIPPVEDRWQHFIKEIRF
jgi:lipopolysaccharide cholinephosphotransferase